MDIELLEYSIKANLIDFKILVDKIKDLITVSVNMI